MLRRNRSHQSWSAKSIYKTEDVLPQLIAEALLTGTERMLTLNDIYIAINKQHPYYSLDAASGRNWQNAIRHNLTLNKAFIKVPRPATEGRGAYWKLEAGAEAQIFRRMARNYNRPKPVSFARQNIYYCDTTDINTVFITVPTWSPLIHGVWGSNPSPIKEVHGSNPACHCCLQLPLKTNSISWTILHFCACVLKNSLKKNKTLHKIKKIYTGPNFLVWISIQLWIKK